MDSAQVVAEFDDLKLASNLETKVAAATKRVLESLRDLKSKLSRYMFRSPQVASTVEEIAHAEQVVANPEAMSAASSGI